MVSATYKITGMTCDHCARAVTQELTSLDDVTDVTVELVPGGVSAVTVSSDLPLGGEAVAAALGEAGEYHLVGA